MKAWFSFSTPRVFGGIASRPGSNRSCERSRSGSYMGCGNSGAAMISSSGSSGLPLELGIELDQPVHSCRDRGSGVQALHQGGLDGSEVERRGVGWVALCQPEALEYPAGGASEGRGVGGVRARRAIGRLRVTGSVQVEIGRRRSSVEDARVKVVEAQQARGAQLLGGRP